MTTIPFLIVRVNLSSKCSGTTLNSYMIVLLLKFIYNCFIALC